MGFFELLIFTDVKKFKKMIQLTEHNSSIKQRQSRTFSSMAAAVKLNWNAGRPIGSLYFPVNNNLFTHALFYCATSIQEILGFRKIV
ncbi:hypothetical protein ASG81_20435 [Paenibacillus sp. Soil522]|nr:hypothetical protein ASG81_20435 [Paenibacillus sp. Soil522]